MLTLPACSVLKPTSLGPTVSDLFCRKEPFENGPFTTQAENWNGRAAMMGFTFLIITEALSGKSIPQFYGLL